MTFSYTPFASDRDRVRFHIGDTDAGAPIFTDAQIDALIVEMGGWREAVIAALEHLIALTSQPGFTADWLTVDLESARRSYTIVLKQKRQAFGLAGVGAGMVLARRADE